MKRTPLKKKTKLKRTRWDRTKQHFPNTKEEMFTFFISIWDPIAHKKCQSCGKPLGGIPRSYYFDHLIEKSKRPDLAMEKDNIFLCCLECHALKTDGHPTPKHQEAIEKAKERFGIN